MVPPDPDQDLAPITVRVATAVRLTGLSRSRIYELIQAGDIEIVKVGRATLCAMTASSA
ncbi:excisionase [Sphingobium indicum B90A]|uniref:Excisionase n=2 Tax=Sphingobium indicum TaxID=332055 RepID=A0A1L5BU97_SPHIB|nr:excisionase [Sphingobium indicum]APL96402.1 excisionase [Sphingobium indicum B90A]